MNRDSRLSVGDAAPITNQYPDHSPDFGQGWLFSNAVSEQQAGQLLLNNKRWMSAA
ncbi:MAG: hypothetical protein V3T53_15300 [Phycisphaerales bacterium]